MYWLLDKFSNLFRRTRVSIRFYMGVAPFSNNSDLSSSIQLGENSRIKVVNKRLLFTISSCIIFCFFNVSEIKYVSSNNVCVLNHCLDVALSPFGCTTSLPRERFGVWVYGETSNPPLIVNLLISPLNPTDLCNLCGKKRTVRQEFSTCIHFFCSLCWSLGWFVRKFFKRRNNYYDDSI